MSRQESDFGTIETQNQGGGITKGYNREGDRVAMVNYQNHFDELYYRGIIDHKQYIAGTYLRNDAEKARQFSYIKSSADFGIQGNMSDYVAEAILKAKDKYKAILSILDKTLIRGFSEREVVERIVIDDGYLTSFTKNARKRRDIRQQLRNGLDKLVKHYHI